MRFIVTEKAQRPASRDGTCFYCHQAIGAEHKFDCVLIQKKVKVRTVIEYEIEVPAHWDAGMIEFHRNESSWCADNMVRELQKIADSKTDCLCNHAAIACVNDAGEPYLSEE